jgi:hypothetical protein
MRTVAAEESNLCSSKADRASVRCGLEEKTKIFFFSSNCFSILARVALTP